VECLVVRSGIFFFSTNKSDGRLETSP
jgi:hypothetical protein